VAQQYELKERTIRHILQEEHTDDAQQ
jgi:hypothetical protein